ncbi:MAG: hypothetical protein NW202_13505 [Nitrospira sp.]|nr:hypothetical protein [Nitrospira sp.]
MPQEAIPFGMQLSGQTNLAGAPGVAINVIVDKTGTVRRRPGIKAPTNLPTAVIDANGITGLHHPADGRSDLLAVGNGAVRSIYRVTSSGAVDLSPGNGVSLDDLDGASRPVFAETEAMVLIAGGGKIQRVFLETFPTVNTPYLSERLGGTPPEATHVIVNRARVLCNNASATDQVNWSSPAAGSNYSGHEEWNGIGDSGYFAGESRPDQIRALAESTAEVYAFGATTTEVWAPDSQSVYVPAAIREYGMASPYCAIRREESFGWIDHKRRVVISDGRSYEVISDPIKQTLDELGVISDCFGYRVVMGPLDGFVWTFPTAGVTLCYQMGGGWAQWRGWSGSAFSQFKVLSHAQRNDTAENVVGMQAGTLGILDFNTYTDLGDRIECYVTSGHQSRGTEKRKLCKAVYLTVSRPTISGDDSSVVSLSYRDDEGAYCEPLRFALEANDRTVTIPFYSLGAYHRRDWRVQFGEGESWALVGAQEEFEVLAT